MTTNAAYCKTNRERIYNFEDPVLQREYPNEDATTQDK